VNSDAEPVIVAIGASAGGIPALRELFAALPADTGAAFVVVLHLAPEHRSELASVLGGWTPMKVLQVEHSEKLQADRVYVIPPDRRLVVVDHVISAEAFDEPPGKRSPIDLFFRSVAERLGDGVAVILSGAGSDGALGVRAVKEAGGIILVQDPSEAEYPSMPRSAIATGAVDFVLPVAMLAARLRDLIQAKRSAVAGAVPDPDEDLVRRILAHLRVRTGHDFAKYKRSTVLRRLARRMQVTRVETYQQYYDVLRANAEEAQALLGDLLISVTTFFRDSESFAVLAKDVLPRLFDGKDVADTIRVWVSGCATGEEAYSVAMLLQEEAARHEHRPQIQVFASDLDARALITAREGRYPAAIESDVTDERLRRHFVREVDGYRVRQELRDIVLFALHDLLKDPPFSRLDLIACRNVMIYLDRELQEQVCSTFHYALNPGGLLVLGASETAEHPQGLFRPLDRNARIYRSNSSPGDKPRLLPRMLGPVRVREHIAQVGRAVTPAEALSDAAMHRRAIEKVAPPSILVDETHRAIHLSDSAGRFLSPSGGPMSGDVVDLVRSELRFELRSALHRLFEQRLPTLSLPIHVQFNGSVHRVLLQVKAADSAPGELQRGVVMFIEGEAIDESAVAPSQHQASSEAMRRLADELELTQARLRTVREESDTANEELRAANEELQSINEEYRSTAEELETSKEELQSINEELQTVNIELKLKLDTISRAHSDLQNLMAATDFGTLFLDSTLRIKRFTERVTELFSITPADEGRPITDFAHQLDYDALVKDCRAVLADLAPVRRQLSSRGGRWYDVRLRPYRTVEDKIDGVVITFVDVSDLLLAEAAVERGERRLGQQQRLIDLSRDPIFVWDLAAGIVEWNRGSEELYGYSRAEALGQPKDQLLRTTVPGSSFAELKSRLLRDGTWSGELHHRAKDGRELVVESRLQLERVDGRPLVLESTRDISERKAWEARQRLLLRELTHRVKNTLTIVQSIASQTARNTASGPEFVARFAGRLAALAASHNLLVESEWKGADLEALARAQLAPYSADNAGRVRIRGERTTLPAELATPFGLVLHELAANAAKYGALSVPSGSVDVSWTANGQNAERILNVVWREKDGPPVATPPVRQGFGSKLIDNGIPNASVNRAFGPEGLVCTIDLALPEPDGERPAAEA
jgi:two-component system, chemotaxis family, CheB/CheR fusion protein